MSTFISQRTDQFDYFDRQLGHPSWAGKRIIDFGGNAGNILSGARGNINPADYWSVDLSRDAIALGQERYPAAHMIFYDRRSEEFNPDGVPGLPIPDPGVRFDVALALSVFTHTSKAEMLDLVAQLRALLVPGGVLAFTFFDPYWMTPDDWRPVTPPRHAPPGMSNFRWMVRRRLDVSPHVNTDALADRAERVPLLTWTTLVNNEELYFDPDQDGFRPGRRARSYLTFSTAQYIHFLYPDAIIREPVEPEPQHCCILGAA